MIKVALDIRFLHVGMGRKKTSAPAIGGIGRVMLSRLQEIDTSTPKFSFTLILDSRRYSLDKPAIGSSSLQEIYPFPIPLLPTPDHSSIAPTTHTKKMQEKLNRIKISSLGMDIIEAHDDFWAVEDCGIKKKKYKVLVFVHDYVGLKWKNPSELETYINGLKKADHIATVSESIRQELIHRYGFPDSKITTIYNGLDKDTFKVIEKSDKDIEYLRHKFNITKPYLIYIGSWGAKKNIDKIIAAFEHFRTRYQEDIHLVLAVNIAKYSPSQTNKIRALISSSKYAKDIIEISYLQDDDIVLVNNYAKAFLHLAEYEGFCMGVAEAMACGTPIVASKEVAVAKELGLADELLDPNDIDSVVDRIHKILSDESYRQSLLVKQFKVVEHLSWKKATRETLDLYERMMNS